MKDILLNNYPELKACENDIEDAISIITDAFNNGGKLLIAGNGGSMADAEHISGELLKGFLSDRRIKGELEERLKREGVDASKLQGALPAIPLTSFSALSSAFANDCDAEYVYAQLTLALGKSCDVIIGISTSGNASNVKWAMRTAKALGMKTVMLTGEKGAALKAEYDCVIAAPAKDTFRVQEYHLPIYHAICAEIEKRIFG